MVSRQVKQAMRFHKSTKPHQHSPSSSSQVQPKPPNIFEVLRLVDHLRDRESKLLTQLLLLKLINESSTVEAASRNSQVSSLSAKLQDLHMDNEPLRKELAQVRLGGEAAREESEQRIGELQVEIEEMKKYAVSFSLSDSKENSSNSGDAVVSSSSRFQLRENAEVSLAVEKKAGSTTTRTKPLKAVAGAAVTLNDVAESRPMEPSDSKREHAVVNITHCRYNSEDRRAGEFTRPEGPETTSNKEILVAATVDGELTTRETLCTTFTPHLLLLHHRQKQAGDQRRSKVRPQRLLLLPLHPLRRN